MLPGVLAAVLRSLSFPKLLNWDAELDDGRGSFLFGRPIRWILFLHGTQVVPFEIQRGAQATSEHVKPVVAGAVTYGHRFFSKTGRAGRPIRVRSFADYKRALTANYVVLDREARRARITRKLEACATRVGGRIALETDRSALLNEVPDLVEYPSVVTGTFPEEFLTLPAEVLKTTMIHHQHYFPVANRRGRLKPHFLAVTNTPRDNVARIARNRRACAGGKTSRRHDFFGMLTVGADSRTVWMRLDTLLFHQKLGSYREKAERTSVAGWANRGRRAGRR